MAVETKRRAGQVAEGQPILGHPHPRRAGAAPTRQHRDLASLRTELGQQALGLALDAAELAEGGAEDEDAQTRPPYPPAARACNRRGRRLGLARSPEG